jgi:CheY-like chemotaxis protein
LIHWNVSEASSRAAKLEASGFEVDFAPLDPASMKSLRSAPPDLVVIDLSRIPSQGRDLGMWLRKRKATRNVPIVFVDGNAKAVKGARNHLPDATYTSWGRIVSALKRAIANRPKDPVVPKSTMAGYSGTPLPKKLGIKPNSVVALVGAPPDFVATLGEIPGGVTLRQSARGKCDLALWFTKSRNDLERRVDRMGSFARDGLWIIWPKKASGVVTDVSEQVVRETGLAAGLVDYKICAVDETWSGLKFARRKRKQ